MEFKFFFCLITVGETLTDDSVKELESLKKILTNTKDGSEGENEISVNESQTSVISNVNGHKSAHKEVKNEVVGNRKIYGKFSQNIDVMRYMNEKPKSAVETEVEIPSKGIHYIMKSDLVSDNNHKKKDDNYTEFKRARNDIERLNTFSEIEYSPHHMAEYVFWTGDEKGVALAIEEFLQEGLMSRQEAINFLQSIKLNLDIMQSQYKGLSGINEKPRNKETSNRKRKGLTKMKLPRKPKRDLYDEQEENSKLPLIDLPRVKSDSSDIMPPSKNYKQSFSLHQLNIPKTESITRDYSVQRNKSYPKLPIISKTFERGPENYDDYDEIAERLRMSTTSQNEYSLEEVVSELAEIMFSESLTKGNSAAQKAVQKFSAFLQKEVENDQISRKLQRKILDILSSALMNVIAENPELLSKSKEELHVIFNRISPTSEALRQLLLLGTKPLSAQPNLEEGLDEKNMLLKNKKLNKELLQHV